MKVILRIKCIMNRVIDFNFPINLDALYGLKDKLTMILWAGDCVHNGITDIERLPYFDVYICIGYPYTLQDNINYINDRKKPGIICIIDVKNPSQMSEFVKLFKGRFTLIESDYHGNTPKMSPEYYTALLEPNGRAYNIEGINGLIIYMRDFQDVLEVFAPILSSELNDKRRYTADMIQLALDNKLPVDMAWASPDIKDPYYKNIYEDQIRFSEDRKSLNPNHITRYLFTSDTLEEYWDQLSPTLLLFNLNRANDFCPINDVIGQYIDRFKTYIKSKMNKLVDNVAEFDEMVGDTLEKIQKLYKLSIISKEFAAFESHFGSYFDERVQKVVYGHYLVLKK